MPLVLLIGGARSGKSELALRMAAGQPAPVTFIATAEPGDREMEERIAQHRGERPPSWRTVEEPLRLHQAIEGVASADCVLIDCLTLWTSNALTRLGPAAAIAHAGAAAGAAAARRGLTVAVTNEVGLGVVPDNALGRIYRDLLGHVNTIWAEAAGEVLLLVAGRALRLDRTVTLIGTFR